MISLQFLSSSSLPLSSIWYIAIIFFYDADTLISWFDMCDLKEVIERVDWQIILMRGKPSFWRKSPDQPARWKYETKDSLRQEFLCVRRLLIICIQHASSSGFVIPKVQICHPASSPPPSFCRSERQRVFVQRIATLPKKRNKEGAHSHTHQHKSGSILAKMLSRDMFGLMPFWYLNY